MLDCTWNELEAEIVLRNLNLPVAEQQRLHRRYLKLREEYREGLAVPASSKKEGRPA